MITIATKKATMVDSNVAKVGVELNATSPNELIGEHFVYMTYGTFVFDNGALKVTQDNADKLKADGVIK